MSDNKQPKTLPCPFCGEMPKANTWTMHGITESRCFCDNEKCPVYLSKTIAIDDWNARPIEDALNKRIAELEAENAKLKAEPKPLAYWSDEKKQTYADNEGRSAKGARNE